MSFECYRIGDLLLDAGTQEVSRNGAVLSIPRLSFKLLLTLARHAPNVVSTQQLEKEVWTGLVVDRGTVNKRVLLLRKSLQEEEQDEPYIAVVRGSGYRLVAPVERLQDPDDEAAENTGNWARRYHKGAVVARNISYWLLGIVAVVALFQGFRNSAEGPVPAAAVSGPDRHSVAVLPFVDMSDDQTSQYLGDGIAEEIINLLTNMRGMQVAARTSSFTFRNSKKTVQEIGAELNVAAVLEGSVRRSGNDLRVTAQLIDTRTGYHIWSQDYDRPFNEVFSVQDDIAVNIVQALQVSLDENARPDSKKNTTDNAEAFALYLKGRSLLNERIALRAEGLQEALGYFKQAIAEAPKFARPYAGAAAAQALLPSYDPQLERGSHFGKAMEDAALALEIDPASTDALEVMAYIQSSRGNLLQAAAIFEQIENLGSRDSDYIHWRSLMMMRLGYFDSLLDGLKSAYRYDPLNQRIGWSLATDLILAGKPQEAADVLKPLGYYRYRKYSLALTAIALKDFRRARALLRGARLRSGTLPAVYADLVIDGIADPARAKSAAERIVAAEKSGELDKLVSFEALLTMGSPRVYDLGIDIDKDIGNKQILIEFWNLWSVDLRRDPRFKDWVRQLGYVEFWKKYGWPDRCRPTGPSDFECI